MNEIPGVHEIPGVEETPEPTGVAEGINPDADFPPFPHPPGTEDVTIIQTKIEQVVVKDVIQGNNVSDVDTYSKNDAKIGNNDNDNNNKNNNENDNNNYNDNNNDNDNNNNNNNNTAIDDNDKDYDNKIFHPSNPSPSENQAWTFPHMLLRKQIRISYSHLHK